MLVALMHVCRYGWNGLVITHLRRLILTS